MTRDDIIRMANKAWEQSGEGWVDDAWFNDRAAALEGFAALVAAAEREACAKVCDAIDVEYEGEDVLATWCSWAIRARSQGRGLSNRNATKIT